MNDILNIADGVRASRSILTNDIRFVRCLGRENTHAYASVDVDNIDGINATWYGDAPSARVVLFVQDDNDPEGDHPDEFQTVVEGSFTWARFAHQAPAVPAQLMDDPELVILGLMSSKTVTILLEPTRHEDPEDRMIKVTARLQSGPWVGDLVGYLKDSSCVRM